MKEFDTYNREPQLENTWMASTVFALYVIAIGGSITLMALAYWQALPWTLATLASTGAWVLALGLKFADKQRSKRCRHCGKVLGHVTRGLILNNEYLSLRGIKTGDSFITQCRWGSKPFISRPAKITHRAHACHHCRVAQTGYFQYFEAPNEEEQELLEQTLVDRAA